VWGALFIDAGRAVTEWNDYTPAWGYGAGIRWRSPIGPLRAVLLLGRVPGVELEGARGTPGEGRIERSPG
jgi:hypothetical protein